MTTLSPIIAAVNSPTPRVEIDPNSGHVIVVLGMHRSGTSMVTRALQTLGVPLGDNLYPAAVDNPKGFWEDRDCLQINEELLRHLGSAYDQPGLGWQISWSDPVVSDLGARAADVLKRRLLQSGGVWGFKDPRTCRLLEFWCPVMAAAGYTTSFVLAIRNPASVARSLERRNEIPCEKSYLLWLQHVIPAVVLSAGSPRRVVVDYDQMMDRPVSGLQRMATALGLPMDKASAAVIDFERDFLDESLRHTRFFAADLALDPRVPRQVAKIYGLLLDAADNRFLIDSPGLQQYFSAAYHFLADLTPVFHYADALEVERASLTKSIADQAEQLAGAEQSAWLAAQQAAEQRVRAEAAENEVKNQAARAQNLSRQLNTALARVTAIEASPSWRTLIFIRSRLRSHPWIIRLARRGVRLFAGQAGSIAAANQRRPNRDVWFDPDWYASQEGGAATDDYNHFITYGAAQGRLPSPLTEHVMQSFAAGVRFTPRIHAALDEASAPWRARMPLSSLWMLTPLFVPEWHNKAVAPLENFIVYLRNGLVNGTSPGPLFDADVYLRRAAAAGLPPLGPDESPVMHFLSHGPAGRIVPTERFDEAFYRTTYPDIDTPSVWGFEHFIRWGVFEGRRPNARPVLQFSQGVSSRSDTRMPQALLHWYKLDFPDDAAEFDDGIPPAYERRLNELVDSGRLEQIFAEARTIEPEVGEASSLAGYYLAPFHDTLASVHAEARRRIPATHYDSVLCVPWIRTGGADLVAGLLARALLRIRPHERVLILRTDHPAFERANWLPAEADSVDISDLTKNLQPRQAENLLRAVFRGVTPRRIFNVNSRLCWTTSRDHGANLAATFPTYAYLFCWDLTPSGQRAGYPIEFFASTADHMTAYLTDTIYLRDELTKMYRLPETTRERIKPLFTPAQTHVQTPSIARRVLESGAQGSRQLVLWAGRLDRQKRFDLVQDIARRMPGVEFRCWGASLLDLPPDLTTLPANVIMQGSFERFDDLPLADAGAWLFTSLWEGMPTTIIELAVRGVAVVASAVSGVPELIRPDTGWPVPPDAGVSDYVAALRSALDDPREAVRRAEALQRLVASRYTEEVYDAALDALLAAEKPL